MKYYKYMQCLRKTVLEPLCTRRSVAGVGTGPLCLIVLMYKGSVSKEPLCTVNTAHRAFSSRLQFRTVIKRLIFSSRLFMFGGKLVVQKSPNFGIGTFVYAHFESSMNYCVQTI